MPPPFSDIQSLSLSRLVPSFPVLLDTNALLLHLNSRIYLCDSSWHLTDLTDLFMWPLLALDYHQHYLTSICILLSFWSHIFFCSAWSPRLPPSCDSWPLFPTWVLLCLTFFLSSASYTSSYIILLLQSGTLFHNHKPIHFFIQNLPVNVKIVKYCKMYSLLVPFDSCKDLK